MEKLLVQQAIYLGWGEVKMEGTLLLTPSHLQSLNQACLYHPTAPQLAAQVLQQWL